MLDPDFVLAVDASTGNIILALGDQPRFFRDVAEFQDFVADLEAALPRLTRCAAALTEEDNPSSCGWSDPKNWSVRAEGPDVDVGKTGVPGGCSYSERLAAVTGWTEALAFLEVRAGFPVALGVNLTFSEALDLQRRAEAYGLITTMSAEPRPGSGAEHDQS